jgi:hypothetical protein
VSEEAAEKEKEAVVRYIAHSLKQGKKLYYEGSGEQMSHLDGILTTVDYLEAALEVKWRRFDYKTLMEQHSGEMLLGSDKVLAGKAFAFAFRKPTKLLYLLTDCLLVQELVDGKGDTPEMIREAWVEGPKSDDDRSKIRKANCYYKAETAEKIRL